MTKLTKKQEKSSPFQVRTWWGKVDSNHRRHCQQIYSLSPLATREFPQIFHSPVSDEVELVDGFEPPTC